MAEKGAVDEEDDADESWVLIRILGGTIAKGFSSGEEVNGGVVDGVGKGDCSGDPV